MYVAMTRACRRLQLYVPVRYYHRPRGSDDAHGYGKPSRFLTEDVQRLCAIDRAGDEPAQLRAIRASSQRIEVSVDSLFE